MNYSGTYHPADWWQEKPNGDTLCTLCPRYCLIHPGQNGFCYIRQNEAGKLVSLGYGRPTGFAIDPIEKKPLNHFLPGSGILSFGTAGCNLGCKFCQNWSISKARTDNRQAQEVSPETVVQLARQHRAPSIAFTYNDPTIFAEYVVDISRLAREEQIRSVMVTAGYIDAEARKDVYKYIDAANVDLKAFSEQFYQKLTLSHLAPVLDTLKWLKHETDVWLEITTLLIPGENDSDEEISALCGWIAASLDETVPLHFTAFHPDFRLRGHNATPPQTLQRARNIALRTGLKYVYVGNVYDRAGQSTYCPACGTTLIERDWHTVTSNRLSGSNCPDCGHKIAGVF